MRVCAYVCVCVCVLKKWRRQNDMQKKKYNHFDKNVGYQKYSNPSKQISIKTKAILLHTIFIKINLSFMCLFFFQQIKT